jgi:hypothetical protein
MHFFVKNRIESNQTASDYSKGDNEMNEKSDYDPKLSAEARHRETDQVIQQGVRSERIEFVRWQICI